MDGTEEAIPDGVNTGNSLFHYINLALVIIDLVTIIGLTLANPLHQLLFSFALIHGLFLSPSIFYHVFPGLRTSFVFTWIAKSLSSLTLGIFVISLAIYILDMDNPRSNRVMKSIVLGVTGPIAIIAGTLLMILNVEAEPQVVKYILTQGETSSYQSGMMV
ncbi:unnamed protein product [Moneuplotes crassus]|uniref:Uncharacterized protein n=1 Tax=Euplotes crassus TaxID=5936 RepID=A0AAD1Y212_EUPCR|nr:unnamed protein product [Moneuplotes crassus]